MIHTHAFRDRMTKKKQLTEGIKNIPIRAYLFWQYFGFLCYAAMKLLCRDGVKPTKKQKKLSGYI